MNRFNVKAVAVLFLLSGMVGQRMAVAETAKPADVTYTKDIAAILWKNCAGCHRPGEVGPFSLLKYQDAAKRADFLVQITADKRMPPWKAEAGHVQYRDERRLSEEDLAKLAAWAEAGAPEGDPKDLPEAPKFAEGWQLGEPDMILKLEESFTIPADGNDIYRCFVLPMNISEDRYVEAVEFRPGNRRVVHHAIMYLDALGQGQKKDAADPGPGYESFGGPGILPTGSLGGWAPGATPMRFPADMGRFVKKGSQLIMQVHYHPWGKEEQDQSQLGVYFTKTRPSQVVLGIPMIQTRLKIPAGEARHRVTTETVVPADVLAIGISPHMHLIGREMKVTATAPDGNQQVLLWIKDWDFNWQGAYGFATPIPIKKGTKLELEAFYDNSQDNPKNPNSPPKMVRWGEQTTDEMCLCGLTVATADHASMTALALMRGARIGLIFGGGFPVDTMKLAGGVPIPDDYKAALAPFDKNSDGRLSDEEVNAMPPGVKERVRAAISELVGGAE